MLQDRLHTQAPPPPPPPYVPLNGGTRCLLVGGGGGGKRCEFGKNNIGNFVIIVIFYSYMGERAYWDGRQGPACGGCVVGGGGWETGKSHTKTIHKVSKRNKKQNSGFRVPAPPPSTPHWACHYIGMRTWASWHVQARIICTNT
jgi:hypothetical protein